MARRVSARKSTSLACSACGIGKEDNGVEFAGCYHGAQLLVAAPGAPVKPMYGEFRMRLLQHCTGAARTDQAVAFQCLGVTADPGGEHCLCGRCAQQHRCAAVPWRSGRHGV